MPKKINKNLSALKGLTIITMPKVKTSAQNNRFNHHNFELALKVQIVLSNISKTDINKISENNVAKIFDDAIAFALAKNKIPSNREAPDTILS